MGSIGKTVAESRNSGTVSTTTGNSVTRKEALNRMNQILRSRSNGAAYSQEQRSEVINSLNGMKAGTVLEGSYPRGVKVTYTKTGEDTWNESYSNGQSREISTKTLSSQFVGYGSGSTPDATGFEIKGRNSSSSGNNTKIPAFVRNSKSNSTVVTKTGNRTLIDLSSRDVTAAHIRTLEKEGWKRRGKSDTTWYK